MGPELRLCWRKRDVLRNALKSEFLRKKYNPANYNADGGMVFDAAVQRWHSMQFCYNDHFKPTLGNFMKFNLLLTFPCIALYQVIWGPAHNDWLRKCTRGEVPYDHQSRRLPWFAN